MNILYPMKLLSKSLMVSRAPPSKPFEEEFVPLE